MQMKKVTLQDAFGSVNFFLLPYFIPQQVRLALEDSSIRTASEAFEKLIDQNREQIDPNERNVLLAHGFFMRQKPFFERKKRAARAAAVFRLRDLGGNQRPDRPCLLRRAV